MTDQFDEIEPGQWSVAEDHPLYDNVSIAHLKIEDGVLLVDTNSVNRSDRMLVRLKQLIGGFEVIERSDKSIAEVMRDTDSMDDPFAESERADVPEEVIEALEAHREKLEDRWLDESIPALGGMTPRQASQDPTRKEDLLRLLNEF